jgi:hypothetical protein
MNDKVWIEKICFEALDILGSLGVPLEGLTARRKEKMAKAFISVAGLRPQQNWTEIKYSDPDHQLRSRDIIRWMNDNLDETISMGSYDDIRRKDLIFAVEVGVVLKAAGNEDAATNDGTRGYAINPQFVELLKTYGTNEWSENLNKFMVGKALLVDILQQKRELSMLPVNIDGIQIVFSPGEHNKIQKAIIENFLPFFGYGANVLYVGDTSDKYLYRKVDLLNELNIFEISHDKLPDVLAYSRQKNWLYVIEAVHSANPIDPMRKRTLEQLLSKCSAELIFVTAFLDRNSFRKFVVDIAWETEVWIADNPDHLIHFNGDKFLGPYKNQT